jgi:hypothetical protein
MGTMMSSFPSCPRVHVIKNFAARDPVNVGCMIGVLIFHCVCDN